MKKQFASWLVVLAVWGCSAAAQQESTFPRVVNFDVNEMDWTVAQVFARAWKMSHGGTCPHEVAVVLRMQNGRYVAELQQSNNKHYTTSVTVTPGVVALVHTHPNARPAEPSPTDRRIADRLGLPVVTLSSRGVYAYDPSTRKTTKVMAGVTWLDRANWQPAETLVAQR